MTKFVISGGNYSGKTTIINMLKKQGFKTIPESGRMVIKEEQTKKNGLTPKKDLFKLQMKILRKQLVLESKYKDDNVIFLDRSLVDGIVYLKMKHEKVPGKFIELAKNRYYKKVFFLEMLPSYKKDDERWENKDIAKKLNESIKETYLELGYEIIDIPATSAEKRINIIKKHIKKWIRI